MPRKSDWNSPTKPLRLPEHTHDACLSLAYHLDNQAPGETYEKSLKAELIQLIRRHEGKLEGLDEWIDLITSPKYRRRPLREDVLNQKYRDIAFALAGHPTSDGCKGIFTAANESEVEPLLLLLLMELVAAVDRPCGGSVHQLGRDTAA